MAVSSVTGTTGAGTTQPTLFVAGAAKSGTSSLHVCLDAHPLVCMSTPKEPHCLVRIGDDDAVRAAYGKIFAGQADAAVRGESSTNYQVLEDVPVRMHRLYPDAKTIFILRNPVDRAWSHYRWLVSLGNERRPLREAFLADKTDRPDFANGIAGNYRYYFAHGRYGFNINRFGELYGRDAMLTLTTEAFAAQPSTELQRCFAFLGVENFAVEPTDRENVTGNPRLPRTTALLLGREVVHPDRTDAAGRALTATHRFVRRTPGVRRLARSTGRRLQQWNRSSPNLTESDRRWLAGQYLDDVAELRATTGLPFDEWSADFPP